jgi:hypothetical protein
MSLFLIVADFAVDAAIAEIFDECAKCEDGKGDIKKVTEHD